MDRFMQQVLTLFGVVILSAALAHAQETPDGGPLRIREIRTDIATVYSEEQATNSAWARNVNRFHIPTRESVIRTQLLFKEGDPLDKELLDASERSLRKFKFLNKAQVVVVPVDENTVDVEVHTKDAWSLVPGANIKGGGDLYVIKAHLMEVNLLGYGKKVFVEAEYESDVGTSTIIGYSDYQLFNTRWVGLAKYKTGPLIESFAVNAYLPLYSPDSVWSYGGGAYTADAIIRLFEEGEESSRFEKDQDRLSGFLTRTFGPRFQKKTVKFKLQYLKADYSPLGAETTIPPPADQINLTPTLGMTAEKVKWVENTYIDKMGIVEDDKLGHLYGGRGGYGIPLEGGFELWDVRVIATKHSAFAHEQILYLDAVADSEVVRNTVLFGNVRYYKKFSRHTFA